MKTRRKKTRGLIQKSILFICTITVLSTTGITYAYWNDGLRIDTRVSTGNLDVRFDPNLVLHDLNGKGQINVRFQDNRTVWVEGTVEEAFREIMEENSEETVIKPEYSDYQGFLKFDIINTGSTPAKLAENKLENDSGNVSLQPDNQSSPILPGNSGTDSVISKELQIQAGMNGEGSSFDFQAEMVFNQPN